jgi:hypothetical protein
MAEEREEFARFVRSVPESQLEAVEPLQLRRVFGEEELRRLWESLDSRWNVKKHHYWWPLREGTAPPDVVTFHTDWLDEMKVATVREILICHGISRVWEFREFGEWGWSKASMRWSRRRREKRATGPRRVPTGLCMPHTSHPLR